MESATIALLVAILLMTGAAPAIAAGAKGGGMACDERSFTPDDATLRVGRAVGTGRIQVLGGTGPIGLGQALLLGASRPRHVCALFANGLEARAAGSDQSSGQQDDWSSTRAHAASGAVDSPIDLIGGHGRHLESAGCLLPPRGQHGHWLKTKCLNREIAVVGCAGQPLVHLLAIARPRRSSRSRPRLS
jgi:hypothetical protein